VIPVRRVRFPSTSATKDSGCAAPANVLESSTMKKVVLLLIVILLLVFAAKKVRDV
jgi:hypothetical protein